MKTFQGVKWWHLLNDALNSFQELLRKASWNPWKCFMPFIDDKCLMKSSNFLFFFQELVERTILTKNELFNDSTLIITPSDAPTVSWLPSRRKQPGIFKEVMKRPRVDEASRIFLVQFRKTSAKKTT